MSLMRILLLLSCCCCWSLVSAQQAPSEQTLFNTVKQQMLQEKELNHQREQQFLQQTKQQASRVQALKKELAQLDREEKSLQQRFNDNEIKISYLNKQWEEKSGELSEVFSQQKEFIQSLKESIIASPTNIHHPERLMLFDGLGQGKLVSIQEMQQSLDLLRQELDLRARIEKKPAQVVLPSGEVTELEVVRLGHFTLAGSAGFIVYDAEQNAAYMPSEQPPAALVEQIQSLSLSSPVAVVDITRGLLLKHAAQQPSVVERLGQGGIVGYIIVGLGCLGVLVAAWRLLYLSEVARRVSQQIKQIDKLSLANPVGRVVSVYQPQLKDNVAALELRISEALAREVGKLEAGHGFVKLLSAVAPLLGLLGTVTGMIATFQSITQYGTGDPKLMAGGISQALVTTVLGLIAAIPLIFAHHVIQSRAKKLGYILNEQTAAYIAQRMESSHG